MEEDVRVSTVELFFDIVFVFAITQLTTLLAAEPNWTGLGKAVLIFGNVWWMYGGYAWLTNAVPPRATLLRLFMLAGMAGYLIVALAIPRAFGPSGVAFGIGYLVVTAVHTGMFLRASEGGTVRAMLRLGPYNAITSILLLLAGVFSGSGRWGLWIAAFALHWASPAVTPVGDFRIRAPHFVERHGTIVLIALGESVVAVGIGVQGRNLTTGLVLTALLGLLVASALWWLYFDGEDERAERALTHAAPTRAPWLALFGFGYVFLPVLGGIVVFASGMKRAILNFGTPAPTATAWFLAAGVAGYVAALAILRRVLGTGPAAPRLVIAALALATVFAGREASPELQLAALSTLLIAGIVGEGILARRSPR
jgi:low temperature requirement protein LtrA